MPETRWRRSEIGYCSNVHPSESLAKLADAVKRPINAVRLARDLERMAAGLWISAEAVTAIVANAQSQAKFATLLQEQHIDLVTLNGFPFGNFHSEQVKENAYFPDWADPRRYHYSCALAQLLARSLGSEQREGSISSVPLGYRPHWDADKHDQALAQLCRLANFLHQLKQETGAHIRLCLEMEPGCVLEQSEEAVDFFVNDLPAAAHRHKVDESYIHDHLGLCYDVCHQAVMFENAVDSLKMLTDAGITIGKIQLSSALHIEHPADAKQVLASYAEPRYLHQVRSKAPGRPLLGSMDLPQALDGDALPTDSPWRIHFHIPLHAHILGDECLGTTQQENGKVFDFLAAHPHITPHLEVETYTWSVLPQSLQAESSASLVNGIHSELRWVEQELEQRGLLVES